MFFGDVIVGNCRLIINSLEDWCLGYGNYWYYCSILDNIIYDSDICCIICLNSSCFFNCFG